MLRDLIKEDLKHIWHPCTQMKDHESDMPLIPIKRAKGVYLYDYNGNRYLDSISSWWVNLFGHSNSYINKKAIKQLSKFEHIIFAGFTHKPAIKLSKRLCKLTKLDKVFFADNGSSAIEIALKMSFHFHKNRGESRNIFLSLENGYHGETLGALSIGDVKLYKEVYGDILIKSMQTKVPRGQSEAEAFKSIQALEEILANYGDKISAFIVEPLVQCAGYMNMYHPIYLQKARELCNRYGIHLIFDEIAVGFGRAGRMFVSELINVKPDILTLSKGLTAGYMPLATVLTTNEIYNQFYCDFYEYDKSFLHSHSYTGNALGCAIANASLDIFERDDVINSNLEKIHYLQRKSEVFKTLSNVKEVRSCGFIVAIELIEYDIKERVNLKIYNFALKNGVFLRPLSNVIYFMPPYVITKKQIDKLVDVTYRAIESLK